MARLLLKRLLLTLTLAPLPVCLFICPPASAQLSNLDEAGKRFAAHFKALKPHPAIVNVADFSSPNSALYPQAHYFAWYLSNSIEVHGKSFLLAPDHREFDKNLAKFRDSSESALQLRDLPKLAAKIGGDYIVAGAVEKTGSSFLLKLAAARISNGTLVDTQTVEIDSSEFLETLSTALRPESGQTLHHAGANGIGMPICYYAPTPQYTDIARLKGLNGVVIMQAIISADGKITQVRLVHMIGYGMDEQAYNTVKLWKCKPAKDSQDNPVAVVVPVEVTFRLN